MTNSNIKKRSTTICLNKDSLLIIHPEKEVIFFRFFSILWNMFFSLVVYFLYYLTDMLKVFISAGKKFYNLETFRFRENKILRFWVFNCRKKKNHCYFVGLKFC